MDESTKHQEARQPSKWLTTTLSAASLAFVLGSALLAVYDSLRADAISLRNQLIVLEAEFNAYNREREIWIKRILELEGEYRGIVSAQSLLRERLVGCERDGGHDE